MIKYIALSLLMVLLMVPLLKQHTPLLNNQFEVEALKGYFAPIDSIPLSTKSWWNGDYQEYKEAALKRNLKIRPFAVRVNNQLHYDLLDYIGTNGVIEGKDGYLFQPSYIRDFIGLSFIGEEEIETQTKKLKYISQVLKEKSNTDVIVAIALDKVLYFKDKVPEEFDISNPSRTNYKAFLEHFTKNDIKFIDFNKYFLSQKEISPHPLATKHGIHWSLYGGMLAADSMLNYVGRLKGKEINEINKTQLVESNVPRKQDNDIGKSINLYRDLETQTYSYFDDHLPQPDSVNNYRPNIVLIGDSFCWTIWGNNIPHRLWGEESLFLYYYKKIWDTKWDRFSGTKMEDKYVLEITENADAIILLYAPVNMDHFGNEFINQTYDQLKAAEEALQN